MQHERNRRAAAAAFASPALQPSVAPSRPGWRRHAPIVAYAVALALLILALAKPQTTVAVDVEQASIMLVTDYSGSMQATDVAPSRLLAARAAAYRFLDKVPKGIRVGAVAFNQQPRTLQSPTTDRDAVRRALASLQPSGGTATGEALDAAITSLQSQVDPIGQRVPSAIILLSDGKQTKGRSSTDIAQRAKELGIPIYTVSLGTASGTIDVQTKSGATETRPVPPDPETLKQIAAITGGQAYTADDADKVTTAYEKLGSALGKRKEHREITAGFAGGALVLILAGGLLSLFWFRRLV
jgi:Ca-activated chloride channel family protein